MCIRDRDFQPRHSLDNSALTDLFSWSESQFNTRLEGSPIRRIGYQRWLRNIAVALGNSGDVKARDALDQTMSGAETDKRPSVRDPVVAEHVDWAQRKLALTSQG